MEQLQEQLEIWLDRLEARLDELGFYQDCMDKLGGVTFSRENIKPGYTVKIHRYGDVVVASTGPKNFKAVSYGWPMQYTDIISIVKAEEANPDAHPFKVGEEFEVTRWNRSLGKYGDTEKVTAKIIRATDKSVTIQIGDEKPFVRKPKHIVWNDINSRKWALQITDWHDGIVYKYKVDD